MEIDFEKTAKILSRGLTALVSLRSLARSGIGIQKLLAAPKAAKSEDKPAKKDDKKEKQLHGALTSLGYKRPEVERAVKELSGKINSDPLPDLVREAIGILNHK